MGRIRRFFTGLLTALLCIGLFLPPSARAADIYFTALNDNLTELTSETMPLWSGGALYVPYTVFVPNRNTIGVDLGITVSYNNRTRNIITLYTSRNINNTKILEFDLDAGTCTDEITGEALSARAIMRNGVPFLPLGVVCDFFGLTYSYTSLSFVPQGYLVRIKNNDVVLSDTDFIDAAGNLINQRLRKYTQSLSSAATTAPDTSPNPGTVVPEEPVSPTNIPTYLAVLGQSVDGLDSILNTLDGRGWKAVFFLTPRMLEEGDLVRRIQGTGHSVGILAQGGSAEETRQLLEQGNRTLEGVLHARTTLAYVPEDQRAALEQEGWVCWDETLLLSPSASVGPSTFASRTLRQLDSRSYTTYLTLEGGADGARVLSTLLNRLNSEHFILNIPMETRL